MANDIKLTLSLTYENGTLKRQYSPGTANIPQASKGVHDQTISATPAEADVSVSTLGTPALCILQNLESTTTGKTWNWGLKSTTGGIPQYFNLYNSLVISLNVSHNISRKSVSTIVILSLFTFCFGRIVNTLIH